MIKKKKINIYMIDYILNLLGFNDNRVNQVLNFRFIVVMLFFFGIIFIVIEVTKSNSTCPQQETIYRYLPRSFKEEQEEPVPIDDLYGKMFKEPSPWVGSFTKVSDVKQLSD
jgi:hypothetical protein